MPKKSTAASLMSPAKTVKPTTDKSAVKARMKALKAAPAVKVAPVCQNANGKASHVMVSAYAGTGKTTTLIEALNVLLGNGSKLIPSDQQKAVWDAICLEKPSSVRFVAFNKSIASELQRRVPQGVEAATLHSFGCKIIRADQRFKGHKVNEWKTVNSLERITGIEYKKMFEAKIPVMVVRNLVSLAKLGLVDMNNPAINDELEAIVEHHQMDVPGNIQTVFGYVVACLKDAIVCHGKSGTMTEIDFDDMIWLPIAMDLHIQKVDLLLIDERQDTNACQQELAYRMAHRLVCVGDNKQAIYGFAGADAYAYQSLITRLGATERGVIELPLTVTRRCGRRIVEEAQRFVPDFEAHESNSEGEICQIKMEKFPETVVDADMVLCRVNAPLVSQCFRLLKAGRKARIQGRDIGKNLIDLIKRFKASNLDEVIEKLAAWHQKEEEKQLKKKFVSESAMIALQDKFDCIMTFVDNSETVDGLINKIESVFSDNGPGVLFSSIHKAKGLEADTVFILHPELINHPMSKTDWAREQDNNCYYIAITRAIHKLVYIQTPPKN